MAGVGTTNDFNQLARDIQDIKKVVQDVATIKKMVEVMVKDVSDVKTAQEKLKTEQEKLKTAQEKLKTAQEKMTARLDILTAKQRNSTIGLLDKLEIVKFLDGTAPTRAEFPETLGSLLVAGDESLPWGGRVGGRPNWSAQKSKQLLKKYRRGTAETSDASDAEPEHSPESRKLRFQLAAEIGIQQTQMVKHYDALVVADLHSDLSDDQPKAK